MSSILRTFHQWFHRKLSNWYWCWQKKHFIKLTVFPFPLISNLRTYRHITGEFPHKRMVIFGDPGRKSFYHHMHESIDSLPMQPVSHPAEIWMHPKSPGWLSYRQYDISSGWLVIDASCPDYMRYYLKSPGWHNEIKTLCHLDDLVVGNISSGWRMANELYHPDDTRP